MKVRVPIPEEARALASLHASIFPGGGWDEAFFQDALFADHDLLLVIGEPLRGLTMARRAGPEAELLTIGTAAPGQGDGHALLGGVLAQLGASGTQRLFLEVAPANKAAKELYRRWGFDEIGRRVRYYADGQDALVMGRDLPL